MFCLVRCRIFATVSRNSRPAPLMLLGSTMTTTPESLLIVEPACPTQIFIMDLEMLVSKLET